MKKSEIEAKYLGLHDALGAREDAADKALFDQQHRQVWANCNTELGARKAELEKSVNLKPDEVQELRELEFMFPKPSPPARNLAAELDALTARVKKLEGV
jgi:hypothetical protein